jgi:hypothetical protein
MWGVKDAGPGSSVRKLNDTDEDNRGSPSPDVGESATTGGHIAPVE